MKQHKDCNFSFAGLKNQVRLAIEAHNVYVLLATVSKLLSYLHFLKIKLWTDACIQYACRGNVKILHMLFVCF